MSKRPDYDHYEHRAQVVINITPSRKGDAILASLDWRRGGGAFETSYIEVMKDDGTGYTIYRVLKFVEDCLLARYEEFLQEGTLLGDASWPDAPQLGQSEA